MDMYLDWMMTNKKKVEVTVDENYIKDDTQEYMIPVYELYIEYYSQLGITFRDPNGIICWYPMNRIIKIESNK